MKSFSQRVIEAAVSIPKGKITTYGDLARACGAGGQAARSITAILSKAHYSGVTGIPFHRIVFSDGRVWKNSKLTTQRMRLYEEEGIEVNEKGYIVNFISLRYEY